jgi:protease YdgD
VIRFASFVFAALALAAAGETARGASERPVVDGWPGNAVGKVNVRGGGFCTATLIAEDEALTAAHCLHDRTGRWYPVGRLAVEFAPHRSRREGYAAVRRILPAPGLIFAADGHAVQPARNWAILKLEGGSRARTVRPVRLATLSQRAGLHAGAYLSVVAYTTQRPFVATLAEGCAVKGLRGQPEILLHDCARTASVAGAPVFLESADGPALVAIQIGTGSLQGEPVGVAALLERTIEPEALMGSAGR